MSASQRQAQAIEAYRRELAFDAAHRQEVRGPCRRCRDVVFWRPQGGQRWRCRTCRPPRAERRVEWLTASQPRT